MKAEKQGQRLWKGKTKEGFFIAFCILLTLASVKLVEEFLLSITTESYTEKVQPLFFWCFLTLSFFFLFYFGIKGQFRKALLVFILWQLIYDFINYSIEAIQYASELYEGIKYERISAEHAYYGNINLSLCDLKIVLTMLSLLIWLWLWKKT